MSTVYEIKHGREVIATTDSERWARFITEDLNTVGAGKYFEYTWAEKSA